MVMYGCGWSRKPGLTLPGLSSLSTGFVVSRVYRRSQVVVERSVAGKGSGSRYGEVNWR